MQFVKRGTVYILVLVFFLCSNQGAEAEIPLGYDLVASNDYLNLYLNSITTEIAVQDHHSKDMWYSNPPGDRVNRDTLSIVYFNPSDDRKRMDSYNDSIEYGQYTIEEVENGVRISYLMGKEWWDDDWLPIMVPQDRFENEILPKVADRDRSWLASKYKLIGLEEMEPGYERVPIATLPNLDKQLGAYTVVSPGKNLSNKDQSTLTLLLMDTVVGANPDKFSDRIEIQLNHIEQLIGMPSYVIDNTIRPWDRDDIIAIMKEIGYTPDEIAKDHIKNQISAPVLNVEVFKITMEYILDGNSLIVNIPIDQIYYPVQVVPNARYITGVSSSFVPTGRTNVFDYFGQIGGELVDFPLYSINVLPHFGASTSGSDGYIFLPDGSGALVDIGVASNLQYARDVYGKDNTIAYGMGEHEYILPINRYNREDVYMPVFGLKDGEKALFSIIESGHGMARIKANTVGSSSQLSRVSGEFILLPYGEIHLAETDRAGRARGDIKAFPDELPGEDITIRYIFLTGADASYVGMANVYREYLVDKYSLVRLPETALGIPFYLDLIGAIPIKTSILGIPLYTTAHLTKFTQAQEIIALLLDQHIDNIHLRYIGWLNGGLFSGMPQKVQLENAVGTKNELMALNGFLQDNGVGFYPNVDFLGIYDNKYSRFDLKKDIAQSLNRQSTWLIKDNLAKAYVLAPTRLDQVIDGFLEGYLRFGIGGLALGDLGKQINSDFAAGRTTLAADSLLLMENGIKKLKDKGNLDLLINRANIYAVPYARHIVNLPLTSNNYNIISKNVPFYQMVLHGYVNYAGIPFNNHADYTFALLKSIETGAYPYFSWMYQEGTVVKQTEFSHLFSSYYGDWLEEAIDLYKQMDEVLSHVVGACIIDHQQLSENVFKTIYDNGLATIVNYDISDYDYNGTVVERRGFSLVEEGQSDEAF